MPLYFAYGSNMDRAAMATRCPRAAAIGPARLIRHRLALTREGWLTATHDPCAVVHGILWDLKLSDVPPLDRYEGVARGLYEKAIQTVTTRGGAKRALIYFGANPGPGAPPAGYIQGVIDAAQKWDLPEAALNALQRFLPRPAALDAAAQSSARRQARPRFATPFDRA